MNFSEVNKYAANFHVMCILYLVNLCDVGTTDFVTTSFVYRDFWCNRSKILNNRFSIHIEITLKSLNKRVSRLAQAQDFS